MNAEDFFNKVSAAGVLAPSFKPTYGQKISPHITAGIDQVASPDTGECWIHKPLIDLFEAARNLVSFPVKINAGSRTVAHEIDLRTQGYHTAAFASPHNLSAFDTQPVVDASEDLFKSVEEWSQAIYAAAKTMNMPTPRLGTKIYQDRIAHVDLVFLFFQPYTDLAHPSSWPELPVNLRNELGSSWRSGVIW